MGAVKAVTIITGANHAGDASTIGGDLATQTLHFDPTHFTIAKDVTTTPPRVKVSLRASFTSLLFALIDTVAGLASNVTDLLTRMALVEEYAVEGGRWDTPAIVVAVDGQNVEASRGTYNRIDMSALGFGETFTVVLPEANAGRLGMRVAVAEVTGASLGGGGATLLVTTTGGQDIDAGNVGPPYALDGIFPRAVFVVVEDAGPVYGWSLESFGGL